MYYVFRPSTRKGCKGWGNLSVFGLNNENQRQISLKIKVKQEEWDLYCSGNYNPAEKMTSLDIKYGAFNLVLSQTQALLKIVSEPSEISSVIKKLKETIGIYRNAKDEDTFFYGDAPVYYTDFASQCLDDIIKGKRLKPRTSDRFADSSILRKRRCLEAFVNYEKSIGKRITLDDITMDFQRSYLQWRIGNNIKTNTTRNDLNEIRTIMRWALEDGITKNAVCLRRGFVPRDENPESIFLTPSMIREMENLKINSFSDYYDIVKNCELSDREKKLCIDKRIKDKWQNIEKTKDLFLLGYYTGQRFSDFCRINEDMIVEYGGRKFIKLIQVKTKKKVFIPLNRKVVPILKRYNGKAPYVEQCYFNILIKLVGYFLGWTWIPDFDFHDDDNEQERKFYEMLSSHTARRSFATNAYAAGVPIKSIMAVTGHEYEEDLRLYIRLQAEDKAIMAGESFKHYI